MTSDQIARPILFSAPMVRALLAGRKTQTRRPVKATKDRNIGCALAPSEIAGEVNHGDYTHSRYGAPGDLLWVRETFSGPHCMEASEGCAAAPPSKWGRSSRIWYWADGNPQDGDWTRPRPSIHMPRWASRLTLRITDARIERLQDISEKDAIAEGVEGAFVEDGRYWRNYGLSDEEAACSPMLNFPTESFRTLWESINGKGSWGANPWVWVLTFDRATPCN
jgi:hypothetical protein